MANNSIKECCVCFGKAIIKNAFGLSLTPKAFWIECECGSRTPICDSPEQALAIWNWMNRDCLPNDLRKSKQNKVKEVKEVKINTPTSNIDNTNNTLKKKRHRRTKKEMEEARSKEALKDKKHAKHR